MSDDKSQINSLKKGFAVLKALSRDQFELSLSDIIRLTNMSPSTVHRYLSTLISLGYVSQSSLTRAYRLTPKVLELGFAVLSNMEIKKRALPHLLDVSREFNITTACSVLDGTEIVYVDRIRSQNLINLEISIGSRLPAYATSMGKVLLSFQEDNLLERLIDEMNLLPLTPHTITDKSVLRRELQDIRKSGYALCRQELSVGLESIAAPVFNKHGVEAAISFNLPNSYEGERESLKETLLVRLLKLAREISI